MSPLAQGLLVFFSAYLAVFLLGFQSKLMRDNRWVSSYFTSWMITFAQTGMTWVIANNHLGIPMYLFLAGNGGSLGIVTAHFFYRFYENRMNAKK